MEIYIYSLIDPRNGLVRYVGKTNDCKRRYNQHTSGVNRKVNHRNRTSAWIKSLANLGLKPEMLIIDSIDSGLWEFWESHYISLYRSWGYNLTNEESGGKSGGNLVSVSTRLKISSSLKGNKNKSGKTLTLDQRKNCANGRKGKTNSDNWHSKVSKSVIQMNLDETFVKEWRSINDAENELGIKNISSVCIGQRKTSGKYKWKFKTN